LPRTRRTTKTSTAFGLRRDLLDATAILLAQARSVLIITGAGLSADSGLSHYRGLPGLLKRKPEDARLIEAALSSEVLAKRPELTWGYLLAMDAAVRGAQPNVGHRVLAECERVIKRTVIMTMNVDRLHQRAGSRDVIEMHGALHDLLCPTCEITRRFDDFSKLAIPPACATCGTALRPDMPLFGEPLPPDPFTRLQVELDAGFDMVIAVGVVSMYPYVARPILLAKAEGIPTVEIGPTTTDVSEVVDFRFRASPARVLELIYETFRQRPGA